jgi:chromosome segregation ATPase
VSEQLEEEAQRYAQNSNYWRERAEQAERALSDTLVKLEESVQSIVQLRAALANSHRQIEYLHETMQAREATLARVEGERDEARGIADCLYKNERGLRVERDGLRKENKRLRAVDCEALGQHQVCDHVIDQLNGLRKEIEGWEQDSLKDKATIDGLRAALEGLYEATADYITVNHLGDIHHNSVMDRARVALGRPGKEST